MESLQILQEKWVKKFAEMQEHFPDQLVTPHLTVCPDGYNSKRIPSVLYVGQATGPNPADEGSPSVEEIRQKIGQFQKKAASRPKSGFWRFALCLSTEIARYTRHTHIALLQNLVWSNICKIGVCEGNPKKQIYESQKELAIQTLRAEIECYKPKLVYWATHKYHLDAVHVTVGDAYDDDSTWTKDRANDQIYTRRPKDGLPAMIRTPHPDRKPRANWDLWIKVACNLIDA